VGRLTLLGLGLVQAATACALVEIDAGRAIRAPGAYRLALQRFRPLLGAVAVFVLVWVVLSTTAILLPVAVWLAIRWSLLAPLIELEGLSALGALRRSGELVRRRWFRVGSLVGISAVLAIGLGPLLGALLIFVSNSSLGLLNLVAGVVRCRCVRRARHLVRSSTPGPGRARAVDERRDLPADPAVPVGRGRGGRPRRRQGKHLVAGHLLLGQRSGEAAAALRWRAAQRRRQVEDTPSRWEMRPPCAA
jgi:hypothetical protein